MMKYRTVKIGYPSVKPSQMRVFISKIPVAAGETIYQTVAIFKEIILATSQVKLSPQLVTDRILLRPIINLHNDTGIRDISQIKSMVQTLKSGGNILSSHLPNIKLVKTKDNDWVLFDGHHSLLAYMLSGRKYLDEVPHLIVMNGENEGVTAGEIAVFFGEHLTASRDVNWRKYVINWQAPLKEQLQPRIQKNMGELLDAIIIKITQ